MAGTDVGQVTTSSSSVPIPQWYSDLSGQFGDTISGALGQYAGLGSNWYDEPTVAPFTDLQEQAAGTAASPYNWQSNFGSGLGALGQYQTAYNPSQTSSFYNPTAYSALSGMTSGFNWQQPLSQAGGALSQYQTGYDPSQTARFMDPYTQNAVNAMYQTSNRNLLENILPGVNSTFTGNGQFGSSRNAEFTNRAIRDTQLANDTTAAGMYNNQFNNAMQQQYNWNQNPLALASSYLGLGTQGAGTASGLAQGLNAMTQGAQQQQYQWNQNPLALASSYLGYGTQGNNNFWNGVNNQYGIGANQQQTQQAGLNTNYQNWLQSLQLPQTLMSQLSQMLPSVSNLYYQRPVTTTTGTTQATSSGGSDLVSLLTGLGALWGSGSGTA